MVSGSTDGKIDGGRKVALITGITGQDGSYLAELLLEKGYVVHGIIRRASNFNTDRIDHIFQDPHEKNKRLILHHGDVTDAGNVSALIERIKPDEVYHLAAQSHVRVSFDIPEYTAQATGVATLHLLEAIRKYSPKSKFYQASSSEMYGKVVQTPQDEKTPFYPRSPYGVAKVFGYWIVVNYRESYDLFACNGILFNHESPRRGLTFVTRKVTSAVAKIALGEDRVIHLGNLNARRDWGYAPEYVEAMWMMMQQPEPSDYVIATGETHSVRELCELAFARIGITLAWRGEGLQEEGFDKKTGKVLVKIDPRYHRPAEVDLLQGRSDKAKQELGWVPKVRFKELVELMVDADIQSIKDGTSHKFR